jgi:hypothetical protein
MADEHTPRARLSRDTDRVIEDDQIAAWRAATPAELARLVDDASTAVRELAIAGIRSRYPDAAEGEILARFAALTMGREIASRAYPELQDLDP